MRIRIFPDLTALFCYCGNNPFSEAEGSENVYYGYLKKYPEDYWVSVNGQKMVPIGFLKGWVRTMIKILLDGK